jgi:hypothetical protein
MTTNFSTCTVNEWIVGDWFRCLFDPTVGLVGAPTMGFLVGVGVWSALYLAGGGRTTTPTVVTILLAATLFPLIPTAFNGIAWTVLLVGASAAVLQTMQKYVLSPATT